MLCVIGIVAASSAQATAPASNPAATPPHQFFSSSDLKWSAGPPSLPPGAKSVVLAGDPNAPGPFTMRIWVPAEYRVPPHIHPAVEHLTVIRGSLKMGLGEKWDDASMHDLVVGAFSVMPQGVKHYVRATTESVVQVHGIGPWGITYVNPSDDPRNAKQAIK
jgi:quercetin dioxygenase-like cupin family protein